MRRPGTARTHCSVAPSALHRAYKDFCEENEYKPIGTPEFKKALQGRGITFQKTRDGNLWFGIALAVKTDPFSDMKPKTEESSDFDSG
jgi:hypothetical protein